MQRPTVLHHVEQWARPSERFLVDTVRSTSATRAVVVAHHRVPGGTAAMWPGRVWDLSGTTGAMPVDAVLGSHPTGRRSRPLNGMPVHVALAALAVAERADVLHSHFALPAPLTWRVARRLRRPFVVSAHGWDVLVGATQAPDIGMALRAATAVVVPSRFLADAVESLGVAPANVRVIPSGVDLATLPFRERTMPAGTPMVTFAGRFAPKKGVLDVARAIASVAAETPVRARFVGHGPLEAELRALLAGLRLQAEVVDGRDPGAVRAALAETDLVMTASRHAADGDAETLGLVNVEAQACGVPVIATRHGGVPDAVSPDGALLVEETGDIVAALADALRTMLAAPDRWPAMSRAGRRHVAARFELSSRTADLEELWLAAAAGARGVDLPSPPSPRDEEPRTSVVVVTHNRAGLLEQTLGALAAQTRPADEVVVVDNGSTDRTADLLADRVRRNDPAGLRVLRRAENLPVAEGRNLAIGVTTGDVVAFTDDDCRPRQTWLEVLVAGMREGIGLVQGRTTADPAQPLVPLARTQWTPAEFGLYETCNVGYDRRALVAAGEPPAGPFDLAFADEIASIVAPGVRRMPFGEDTDLGWRVKRNGVRSRFAVHAVVDHEVWPPDRALLRRRAALAAGFPPLVRRVPELRDRFLWHRFVLGPHRARLWLAALSALAAATLRRPLMLLLVLPYADDVAGLRRLGRPGRRDRIAAAPTIVAIDALETAALLRASVQTRTPVL